MDIRKFFFDNRSYTPIPLIVAVLILAHPTWYTFLTGIVISVVGELIRVWAVAHAGSATRTTSGAGGEELVMTGPYAFIRNPLYLGNFLMASGLCIAAWAWMPWMLLLLVVLFVIQYALIISLEEEYLRNNFGEIYRTYVQNVPRILPRLMPYNSGQERFPSLQKALHSEKSTLTSFVSVSLLIFLRWQLWG